MFTRLASALSRFVQRPEILSKIKEKEIQCKWSEIIRGINKDAEGKSQVVELTKNGELIVRVANHLWLQELSLRRADIHSATLRYYKDIKSIRLVT